MEEILIIIFQFLIEVVFQSLLELPFEIIFDGNPGLRNKTNQRIAWITASLMAGGAMGMVSLMVRPNTLLSSSAARITFLLLAPPLSAAGAVILAKPFTTSSISHRRTKLNAFCAFAFALAMTVVRFTYAQRPG